MVRLLPGDIIDILFGGDQTASEEVKQQAREQLGLNGSYPEQYWRWISGIFQGDFGFSLRNTEPVSNIILESLSVTLELVILALLIAVSSACRSASSRPSSATAPPTTSRGSAAWWASAFPASGWRRCCCCSPHAFRLGSAAHVHLPAGTTRSANLSQFILPAISISVFTMAIVMRMVRATMLEVLGQDYVRTARAKGVDRRTVISKHALRNALIPVVTIVGFEIGVLIGGAAIVEIIFGLPGSRLHAPAGDLRP